MAKISAIIFDVGGVLVQERSLKPIQRKCAEVLNLPFSQVRAAFLESWFVWRIGRITQEQAMNRFLKKLGKPLKLKSRLYPVFQTHSKHRINNGVLNIAARLKKKGYSMIILSNHVREWFDGEIRRHKLRRYFDHIFTSYDIHLAKPDAKIYKHITKKLNLKPGNCVFIDDLRHNVVAAKKLGFNVVPYKNIQQLKAKLRSLKVI